MFAHEVESCLLRTSPRRSSLLGVMYRRRMQDESKISYFAKTNGRFPHKTFGIGQRDRLFHMYAIGKTGVGKSTLLESLALQDIREGRGLAVIDPHGDLAEHLVQQIPEARRGDLVYLDAADPAQPYGYNPLRPVE